LTQPKSIDWEFDWEGHAVIVGDSPLQRWIMASRRFIDLERMFTKGSAI
jgi:hypothetical protein